MENGGGYQSSYEFLKETSLSPTVRKERLYPPPRPQPLSSSTARLQWLKEAVVQVSLEELQEIVLSFALQSQAFQEYLSFRLRHNVAAIDSQQALEEGQKGEEGRTQQALRYANIFSNDLILRSPLQTSSTLSASSSSLSSLDLPPRGPPSLSKSDSAFSVGLSLYSSSSTLSLGSPLSPFEFDQPASSPALLRSTSLRPPSFNEIFQLSLDKISDSSIWEDLKEFETLSSLARDFCYAAVHYGKIIIAERNVSVERKTIRPCTEELGGLAGGEKYIKSGILFKFASAHNIYEDDECAAKAAGHELKGAIGIFNTQESGQAKLHFPLLILIDYLGYRLVAMSVVPIDSINKQSLLYGSPDAGKTVVADEKVHMTMKHVASLLNLKLHVAGSSTKNSQSLYTPCDIEVHQGTDGRLYCLDFARLFPPEPPNSEAKIRSGHLVRLLRPELVRRNSVPLSSDAFSNFSLVDPDAREHETEVRACHSDLLGRIVPLFAGKLIVLFLEELPSFTFSQLISLLHEEGINIRHLGRVRHHLALLLEKSDTLEEAVCSLQRDMFHEVVAKSMGRLLRQQYALLKRESGIGDDNEVDERRVKPLVVRLLNLALGSHQASLLFRQKILDDVFSRLGSGLTGREREILSSLLQQGQSYELFKYLQASSEMLLSPICDLRMKTYHETFFSSPCPFTEEDFRDITGIIDHLSLSIDEDEKVEEKEKVDRGPSPDDVDLRKLALKYFVQRCTGSSDKSFEDSFNVRLLLPTGGEYQYIMRAVRWLDGNIHRLKEDLCFLVTELRELLLIEVCARSMKGNLRRRWREQVQELERPASEPYRAIALDALNGFFGNNTGAKQYRGVTLVLDVESKFPECFSVSEMKTAEGGTEGNGKSTSRFSHPESSSRGQERTNGQHNERDGGRPGTFPLRSYISLGKLFRRVQKLCGLQLSTDCEEAISADCFLREEPFEDTDIVNVSEIVKQIPLLEYAQGTALFISALRREGKERLQLAKKAQRNFQRALTVNSLDYKTLCNWGYLAAAVEKDALLAAKLYRKALAIKPDHSRSLYYYGILFHRSQKREEVRLARSCMKKASESSPTNASLLKDYANMLWIQFGDLHGAEEMYQKAIEASPHHAKALLGYGNFLHNARAGSPDKHVAGWFYLKAYQADSSYLRAVNQLIVYLRQTKSSNHSALYFDVARVAASLVSQAARENYPQRLGRNDRDFKGVCRATSLSIAKAARHAQASKQFSLASELFEAVSLQTFDQNEALLIYTIHLTKFERNYERAEAVYRKCLEQQRQGREKKESSKSTLPRDYAGYIAQHFKGNLHVMVDVLDYLVTSKRGRQEPEGGRDSFVSQAVPLGIKIVGLIRQWNRAKPHMPKDREEGDQMDGAERERDKEPSHKVSKRLANGLGRACELLRLLTEDMETVAYRKGLADEFSREVDLCRKKLDEVEL